jgi:hypothetical protein
MLLEERTKTQTEIYKIIAELDRIALSKPLRVTKRRASSPVQKGIEKGRKKTQTIDMIVEKSNDPVINTYPIMPSDKLASGYGFDVRV